MNEDELESRFRDLVRKDREEAVHQAKSFLAANPRSVRARLLLATAYGLSPRRDMDARTLYEEVLQLDNDNISALTGIALIPGVSDEEGLRLLVRAAELSSSAQVLMNLGFKQWDLGKFHEAHETFQRIESLAKASKDRELLAAANAALRSIRRKEPPRAIPYVIP